MTLLPPSGPYTNDPPAHIPVMAGDIQCSVQPQLLTTVLGSCVSVCLWDERRGLGGMNHFVLPKGPSGEISTRYGDTAIQALITEMRRLGADPAALQAKIFGGAAVLPFTGDSPIGHGNVALAVSHLQRHHIPIVAQRTGGSLGQHIKFSTHTGVVILRYIASTTH